MKRTSRMSKSRRQSTKMSDSTQYIVPFFICLVIGCVIFYFFIMPCGPESFCSKQSNRITQTFIKLSCDNNDTLPKKCDIGIARDDCLRMYRQIETGNSACIRVPYFYRLRKGDRWRHVDKNDCMYVKSRIRSNKPYTKWRSKTNDVLWNKLVEGPASETSFISFSGCNLNTKIKKIYYNSQKEGKIMDVTTNGEYMLGVKTVQMHRK